ncbi:uncharacterized protein LOC117183067 [Belonocnema kinseyi]|uniref:uncharacterized protein LOC117183067 n=1 Tax=Belonocnema kinseyi TaxID=2817044 RepID=UPI00143D8A39|nr:uncharacterized protein LOC117183067 [Belonocnema kinseyi]
MSTKKRQDKIDEFTDEAQDLIDYRTEVENNYYAVLSAATVLLMRGIPKGNSLLNAQANSEKHVKLFHATPQLLLANIRETFCPISGRNLARKTVHDCIRCSRVKPKLMPPIMGNLSSAHVSPSPPFYNTAVDYAGPFSIKYRKGRGCKITKAYELVSDATADAFIAALRCFASRRRKPARIYSDNGTNFIRGNNKLERLGNFLIKESDALGESILNIDIQWYFIPTYAPHFAGIWEAGVKSVKHHLKRVAGDAIFTYEEFSKLLTQIEATLNSLPLTPLSADLNDHSSLTPAHFLISRTFTSVADPDLMHLQEGRLSN